MLIKKNRLKKSAFKFVKDKAGVVPGLWRVGVAIFVVVVFRELLETEKYKMPPALVNPTYAAICRAVGIVPSAVIPTE